MPIGGELGFYLLAPDSSDQHVGGGVVADRDHLAGGFPDRDFGSGRQVLHGPAGHRLEVVGDGELLIPGERSILDNCRGRARSLLGVRMCCGSVCLDLFVEG